MPNKSSVADMLQLIRESGPLSRTDLARLSGLAASTVSLRVEELVRSGLVEEVGDGESRGGRRPRLLRASGGGGVALAADLGTHHARLAVVDLAGNRVADGEVEVTFEDGPAAVLETVSSRLADLAAGRRVLGVGMGLPGPVDVAAGQIVSPSRMPGWHGMRVRDWLTERFGVPAVVDNDANLLALGEYRTRWVHSGVQHLVAVKAGRGIGCGIIAGGAVYHGANGAAGDISHVRVTSPEAVLCGCGRHGCLETVASGAVLLSSLGLDSVTELVAQVYRGDALANQVVRGAGSYLGEVLAVVVNFFNPQVLVVGGSLSAADPLVASLRAAIYERCLPMASEAVTITPATGGVEAGVTGAAWLILDHLAEAATTL
jgi:predicted NBD/HSP70 family sugar kinase